MDAKKQYLAEFLGTFALVFFGAGSILHGGTLVEVALAHGLALICVVYVTGPISGAHINPAITIGMLITKKIDDVRAFMYMISQVLGALLAAFALKYLYPEPALLGTPVLAEGVSFFQAIGIEAILTFFLMFTIYGVAVDKRVPESIYGLCIGLVVTAGALAGGPLTGAALNPARAIGPAIASGHFADQLVYWIGPIVGSVVAAIVYYRWFLKK